MEAKKKFIYDEIVPRIIKGDFIRGNNSIIIKLPCVLNDSKNNFEIPKEEFIRTYWYLIKENIIETIRDYKHKINRHPEDISYLALTGEIMIPKLVKLGILTEKEAEIRKKIPTFEEVYKTYQYEEIIAAMLEKIPDAGQRILEMMKKGYKFNDNCRKVIRDNFDKFNQKELNEEISWNIARGNIDMVDLNEEAKQAIKIQVVELLNSRKDVSISDLIKMQKNGYLGSYETIYYMKLLGRDQKQIKDFLRKNPQILDGLSNRELFVCLKSKLIEDKYLTQRFKTPEDIMQIVALNFQYVDDYEPYMTEEQILRGLRMEEIIPILKKLPKQLMPSSDLLYKFHMNLENMQNENCIQLYFSGRDMLQFAEAGLLEDTRLIDIYEKEQKLYYALTKQKTVICRNENGKREVPSEEFITEKFNKYSIPLESYIDYFSIDRILPILNNPEYSERLIAMLKDIKSKQIIKYGAEKTEDEVEKWIKQYVSLHQKKSKDNPEISRTLTILCEKGILDIEEIISFNIRKTDLLELYNKGRVKLSNISPYLTNEDLTDLYYDDKATLQEITELFSDGLISKEVYKKIFSNDEIIDAIIVGDIKAVNILEAYLKNKLELEDISKIFNKDNKLIREHLTEAITEMAMPEEEQQKNQYISKIEEAYLNHVIDYDLLAKMRDERKIKEEDFKTIIWKYNVKEAIEKIKGKYGEYIFNSGENDGEPIPAPGLGPNPIKKVRTPLYMKYIMELSQNDATPIIIRKGALNGYKFILLEDMKVVILEKEKNSNATYILPVVKALEKAQENTKKELRGTADVEVVKHTANWVENLNKAIQKVQEHTILEGQPDVTYIKDLTEERRKKTKELGETIRRHYIEAKNIGE